MNENQQGGGATTIFLIILAIIFTGGIGFLGYKIFVGDIKVPGLSKKELDASGNPVVDTSASEPTPEVKTVPVVADSSVDAKQWFPLKRVYGADLHKVNPYVKDLQQYLNKFDSAGLDIDGAFGQDTEIAVDSSFGKKQVDMNDYNTEIATRLGKPHVK